MNSSLINNLFSVDYLEIMFLQVAICLNKKKKNNFKNFETCFDSNCKNVFELITLESAK